METNKNQRKVEIICEIHPQHMGNMGEIERMIIQSKVSGADFVKIQLYSSFELFGDKNRSYLDIDIKELKHIHNYCKNIGIKLTASIFDEEKLGWCEELNFDVYKIASRTVNENPQLCQKIISKKKRTIVSLGMYDYSNKLPFNNENVEYLYCVSKYPTNLTEINMPNFDDSFFSGFSDHTVGIEASIYSISRGAKIIEKHFTNNKSINVPTQLGHTGSMDYHDLANLRRIADSITLLRSSNKK
mgnify:CR=1 FL=1